MACSRFYVSGRVQGVFFRASTRDRACALGLAGEVSNLADGRVAVTACGSQAALDSLQQWLWEGPSQAAVSGVEREDCPDECGFSRFEIT
jgi:acylphosphatase